MAARSDDPAHFREPSFLLAKALAKILTPELRAAGYYRLRFLWPWLARPWVRRALRGFAWALLVLYFVFVALVLTLRYALLPEVHRYQAQIEAAASQALGLPVRIGHVAARWDGLNPGLLLEDVRLFAADGNPALILARVEGVLSWQSLWRGEPRFALLALERPALQIRRDRHGEIFVAGISTAGQGDSGALAWVLEQGRIRIRGATLAWEDELRQAPALILEDLHFELDNSGRRHRFGLTGVPPAALAAHLDVRGELEGGADLPWSAWQGQLYTRIDYADLAAWQAWFDYPIDLPQGRGALRLWAEREDGAWRGTADLRLADVRVRLAADLPELDLARLSGRVRLAQGPGRLRLETQGLSLRTGAGLEIQPLDLKAEWRGVAGQPGQGSIAANRVDLAALAGLAAYLPLDAHSRALLERHAPQGRLRQVQLSWDARDGQWRQYSLKAGFEGLGLAAAGVVPGARGLSGRIEASEKGGRLSLDSRASVLALPAVFAEPEIPFDRLLAELRWQPQADGVRVSVERCDFSGPYVSGQVSGTYQSVPDGPGKIDVQGSLSKAVASEAWRFIPKVVNADVPAWLRQGLRAGTGYDARLVLRGDLAHFPFRDPAQGQFLITAKARDVTVHYAPGWPVIEGVAADMRFGVGMEITAQAGSILGARLADVKAVIPDFDVPEEQLLVTGQASGPTAAFLRFIEQSPVAASIEHFTEGMSAEGDGRLVLSLDLPLRRIDAARIKGRYTFEQNRIGFLAGLPPASAVHGHLDFSESAVSVPELSGSFLGQPFKLSAQSAAGGVDIKAHGGFSVRELRRAFDLPLFDHLAGAAPWQAEVRVRGKRADFNLDSTLQGVSSSLPPPFNKGAGERLALRVDKAALPLRGGVAREQIDVRLGQVLNAQFIRARQGNAFVIERGGIGIGEPARLADKGVALFVSQDRLDLDRWRALFGRGAAAPALPLGLVAIQAGQLRVFGREFNEVGLRLRPEASRWRIQLAAREAVGELTWDGGGQGRLSADLKRLRLPGGESGSGPATEALDSLPALDVRIGDFVLGTRRLGRIELHAENAGGRWNLQQIVIDNPDARLTGSGVWEMQGTSRTRLDFRLEASDSGRLLERLGYPGAVRGGTAKLSGKLDWAGAPLAFDAASLGGSLALEAAKGQFSKVDPGVGKLLGLLSLQSIARRLSLDFRDIFNEGFAYDSISGKLRIQNGIMQTEGPLKIDGPAGDVLMQGSVDMRQETQDLLVTVQPEVGGMAAVGAAVAINPVVGAAALLAQNLLQNPLNKMFGFQYRVSGTWAEPRVERIGAAREAAP